MVLIRAADVRVDAVRGACGEVVVRLRSQEEGPPDRLGSPTRRDMGGEGPVDLITPGRLRRPGERAVARAAVGWASTRDRDRLEDRRFPAAVLPGQESHRAL